MDAPPFPVEPPGAEPLLDDPLQAPTDATRKTIASRGAAAGVLRIVLRTVSSRKVMR
jgi:hypothetical protein